MSEPQDLNPYAPSRATLTIPGDLRPRGEDGRTAGVILGRVVYAKRIDKSFVRVKGCGAPFLESLPPFRG